MEFFNCLIIEDNYVDRRLLEGYVRSYPFFHLSGSFSHPLESMELLRNGSIVLLFSDIDMPGISGIEFFKTLPNPPLCIFVTVHPEFALDAFDVHAVDYVLKPIDPDRLDRAILRALDLLEIRAKALRYEHQVEKDSIMIKEGTSANRVNIADIIYLEALTNYTRVVTNVRKYITLQNLKKFLELLPAADFIRIHRSFAVSTHRIQSIDKNEIQVEEIRLPLGKTYRQQAKKILKSGLNRH